MCSGGLDSTVLLAVLHKRFQGEKNFCLRVLHVNHGLRGAESDQDESFVRTQSRMLGLDCEVVRAPSFETSRSQGESLEMWGRRIRQEAAEPWIRQGYAIALGHHRNDLAETFLMRLVRGTGIAHSAGMRPWMSPHWRPLLRWSRDDLAHYARSHDLSFRTDATNWDHSIPRNRVRWDILNRLEHLCQGATEHIAQVAEESWGYQDWINRGLAIRHQDCLTAEDLAPWPPTMHGTCIAEWLRARLGSGSEGMISRKRVETVRQILSSNMRHWVQDLDSSRRLVFRHPHLRLEIAPNSLAPKANKAIRAQQHLRTLRGTPWSFLLPEGGRVTFVDPTTGRHVTLERPEGNDPWLEWSDTSRTDERES